ncbi:MAG TPA: glycosyltransferase family 8 protein [Candidatus Blautia intestinavium]|nr:glycosyltransferase family 8 protein [Candidatus Blautia intestinavium]HJC56195.1 glycosyltransferase family 8 protein [Candidatus Eisenbergiella intestinipullorum]
MTVSENTSVANILYQFNEKYVPFAGTSILSLLIHNRDIDYLHFYVMDEDISDDSKKRIECLILQYGRKVTFLNSEKIIEQLKALGIPSYRGSYSTNLKMFFPTVLAEHIDRLIYIDSDTIINGSLRPLLTYDMAGKPIAMAYDSLGLRHAKLIGNRKTDGYFNAGVILFDVSQWKKLSCTEQIVRYAKDMRSHYISPDQDLLNIVLRGKIALLPLAYNLQPIHLICSPSEYRFLFRPKTYYAEQEIEIAVNSPVIYHFFRFLGEFPWHRDSMHPGKAVFEFYLKQSPWADFHSSYTEQNSKVFRIERWMYQHMPSSLFFVCFRLCYDLFIYKCQLDSNKGKNNPSM